MARNKGGRELAGSGARGPAAGMLPLRSAPARWREAGRISAFCMQKAVLLKKCPLLGREGGAEREAGIGGSNFHMSGRVPRVRRAGRSKGKLET